MVPLRRARRAALAAAALASLAAAGESGAQGSPYVPLEDPAYALLDALAARGHVRALPLLERPYTARQIRLALSADSLRPARGAVAAWHRAAEASAARYELAADRGELRAAAGAVGTAQTSGRRELMLADDASAVLPGAWGRVEAAAGPVVVAARAVADARLARDPEFTGSKKRAVAGRMEEGYAAAQWRLGELFVGRQSRNWGPPRPGGLHLGDYAYSYDQVAGRVGTAGLHLSAVLARLDDFGATPDSTVQRYVALHRIGGRWRQLEFGVSEAVVYGGRGRGLELAYANPANVFMLSQYNEGKAGNISYAFDVALRTAARGTVLGQLLYDDFQIDDCDPACAEPPSYGLTVAAEGLPLVGDHRAFASYTRVSNLAYRTPEPLEQYSAFGVGIGRGFSDYDEARAGVELAVARVAPARLYVAHRRQGEGDYRQPYPAPADYPATPELLAGVVMRVTRVAVEAAGRPVPFLAVAADVGVNRVENDGHLRGQRATRFEGRLRVSADAPWGMRLRESNSTTTLPSRGP